MGANVEPNRETADQNPMDSNTAGPSLREGSTLYYATLRMDESDRNKALNALALIQTLSQCLTGVQEPTVAQTKLQWWSDEINRLELNEARHPATKRCAPALANNSAVQTHLNTILDAATAARFDAPEDDEAWREVVQRDYRARLQVIELAVGSDNHTNDTLLNISLDAFAMAAAWVHILSTLPNRIHHDNIALPPSLYQQFTVAPSVLRQHLRVEGRAAQDTAQSTENDDKINLLLEEAINRAAAALHEAIQSPSYESLHTNKNTKALATWLHIKHAQLILWQKAQPDLLRETMTLTPLKKWYIAFKHR